MVPKEETISLEVRSPYEEQDAPIPLALVIQVQYRMKHVTQTEFQSQYDLGVSTNYRTHFDGIIENSISSSTDTSL